MIGSIDKRAIYLHTDNTGASAQRTGSFLERGRSAGAVGMDLWEYVPQILLLRSYSLTRAMAYPACAGYACQRLPMPWHRSNAWWRVSRTCSWNMVSMMTVTNRRTAMNPRRAPAELQGVVAARVYLLVRSVQPVVGHRDERSYALGSNTPSPGE